MLNEEQYNEIEKRIFLQLIDQNWKLHIQYLEQLRQVIGLRSYGQRDPLVCLLYTSPSPRDQRGSRMPASG